MWFCVHNEWRAMHTSSTHPAHSSEVYLNEHRVLANTSTQYAAFMLWKYVFAYGTYIQMSFMYTSRVMPVISFVNVYATAYEILVVVCYSTCTAYSRIQNTHQLNCIVVLVNIVPCIWMSQLMFLYFVLHILTTTLCVIIVVFLCVLLDWGNVNILIF